MRELTFVVLHCVHVQAPQEKVATEKPDAGSAFVQFIALPSDGDLNSLLAALQG